MVRFAVSETAKRRIVWTVAGIASAIAFSQWFEYEQLQMWMQRKFDSDRWKRTLVIETHRKRLFSAPYMSIDENLTEPKAGKWSGETEDPARYAMLEDLLKSKTIIGKTQKEVEAFLGPSDFSMTYAPNEPLVYYIWTPNGFGTFIVEFRGFKASNILLTLNLSESKDPDELLLQNND